MQLGEKPQNKNDNRISGLSVQRSQKRRSTDIPLQKELVYPSKGRRGKCELTERRGRNEERGLG